MPLQSWRSPVQQQDRGAAQVSGHFLLSTPVLCSCSSHHTDASGGVPVLAGPDRSDDEIRWCEWMWMWECCSSVRKARDAIAPCICSIFRAPGVHAPPPFSAHLLDDAAVLWDFCCSAQIANKGTKVRRNDRAWPRRLHLQRPLCVWCVRRSVIAEDERTVTFKGLSSWACLGPRAAAWAAHRVSQVCLSALEVDHRTSVCKGGDAKPNYL